MVVLDLDGRLMAHSLPPSVAEKVALCTFLASCSKLLPSALLLLPPPLVPAIAVVGVVPKRSKRIAAKLALVGLSKMVSRVQHNRMRKLGLVPEKGPISAEAVAAYNTLFSKPLSQDHVIALSSLFSSSLPLA
uniref:Uncharacterized protein n=1 Tax=Oryza punctata TaxID=4537 RepID=A0A0E0KDH3_ORYPU